MTDETTETQERKRVVVPVPFTDRKIPIPDPVIVPLVPVWRGLSWVAHRVDDAARRVVEAIRGRLR